MKRLATLLLIVTGVLILSAYEENDDSCGNGIIEGTEDCERGKPLDVSCRQSLGFDGGYFPVKLASLIQTDALLYMVITLARELRNVMGLILVVMPVLI